MIILDEADCPVQVKALDKAQSPKTSLGLVGAGDKALVSVTWLEFHLQIPSVLGIDHLVRNFFSSICFGGFFLFCFFLAFFSCCNGF